MRIIKVTGGAGSGKTYITELAAKQLEETIYIAPHMTKYGVITTIEEHIAKRKPFIFFDEVTPEFRNWLVEKVSENAPIRIVLIGNSL